MSGGPFFGKYRATVRINVDPLMTGRIMVEVPDISGNALSSWALPCLPAAGPNMGLFTIPPVGAGVWVEFERGDPDRPIWVGGWYSEADVPVLARTVPPATNGITLQTQAGNGIVISDTLGILITLANGTMIQLTPAGTLTLTGTAAINIVAPLVDVNVGALQVT
jgi:Type VI secretion system/phage-baseplate injector OB domain